MAFANFWECGILWMMENTVNFESSDLISLQLSDVDVVHHQCKISRQQGFEEFRTRDSQ